MRPFWLAAYAGSLSDVVVGEASLALTQVRARRRRQFR